MGTAGNAKGRNPSHGGRATIKQLVLLIPFIGGESMDFQLLVDFINGTAAPIAFAVIVLVMWREDLKRNDGREQEFLGVIRSNTEAINALKSEIERSNNNEV